MGSGQRYLKLNGGNHDYRSGGNNCYQQPGNLPYHELVSFRMNLRNQLIQSARSYLGVQAICAISKETRVLAVTVSVYGARCHGASSSSEHSDADGRGIIGHHIISPRTAKVLEARGALYADLITVLLTGSATPS